MEKKNSLEISSILLNQYVEILDKKYNKIDDNIKTFYENNPEFIDKMWNLDIEELKEDEKEAVYHLMEYHKILKNSFNNFVKENILEKIVNQESIKIKGYNWACAIDLQSKYSNLFFTELDFPMVNKKLNIQLYMGITKAKSNWFENENFNKSEFWDELTKKGYSFCFTPYIKNGAGYPTICNFAVVTNNCSFIKDCSTIYKQLWKAHDVKNIRDNKELLDFLKKNFKDSYNIVIKNLKEYKGKKVYIYPAVCVKYEFSNDLSTITFDDVKNKIIEILEKFGNIETPTDLFIKSVNNTSS